MEMLDQPRNDDYDVSKYGQRGPLSRERGKGGRVFIHRRNHARCVSAGFNIVWLV